MVLAEEITVIEARDRVRVIGAGQHAVLAFELDGWGIFRWVPGRVLLVRKVNGIIVRTGKSAASESKADEEEHKTGERGYSGWGHGSCHSVDR
jgi:hypothetical protein